MASARREDLDAVVGPGRRGRQEERRLRQVRPAREPQHLLVGETLAVEDDRERVARERLGGEDVDLAEASPHRVGSSSGC
jgi:hypothetical protein